MEQVDRFRAVRALGVHYRAGLGVMTAHKRLSTRKHAGCLGARHTDDVRALLGVVEADKASKGFLTTTSDFAPRLRDDILLKPLMPSRIELVDGKQLMVRLAELAKKKP